ncbi:MAG: HNH endonuclease [Alphaproteobacteria bacterium]|nr:MAG: HNH endonuclease [Alphaproteobacteria bacterium]
MRRVDRAMVATPKSLLPGGHGAAELEAAKEHRDDPNPAKKAFKYKAYKRADIRFALETLFHGKCAYCETSYAASAPVDVEHYRPKGGVAEDDAHGGYWWLAMNWENLLPSCIDCNRQRGQKLYVISTSLATLAINAELVPGQSGKKDSFPIAATGIRAVYEALDFSSEHAMLLDPCRDEPEASLMFSFDSGHPTGLILPRGDLSQKERGAVSIQIYGLNRAKLVEDRTRLLRRLEFLADLVIELAGSIADLETPEAARGLAGTPAEGIVSKLRLLRDRTLSELKGATTDDAPYSSMAKAWLANFKARLIIEP